MLFYALFFAAILLALVNTFARTRISYVAIFLTALAFLLGPPMFLFFASLPIAISCCLLIVLTFVCGIRKSPPRTFHLWSLSLVAASFVFVGSLEVPTLLRMAKMRAQNPLVSLETRLEYETEHPRLAFEAPVPAKRVYGDYPPSDSTEARLEEFSNAIDRNRMRTDRYFTLVRIHRGSVQHFINSPGFGVTRGLPGRIGDAMLPETAPVPMPTPVDHDGTPAPGDEPPGNVVPPATGPQFEGPLAKASPVQDGAGAAANAVAQVQPVAKTELWLVHLDGAADFVYADGFGYVKSREEVSGFRPHQFRKLPEFLAAKEGHQMSQWQLARLQLVSLLKHDEPRVYVTENLPQMEEIVDAPSRPLTPFEQAGLAALDRGEDLHITETPGRIRMLGSLRATRKCIECHQVQRGHLLGALSYELVRDPRPAITKMDEPDTL